MDNCQSWFPLILMCIALKNSKEISQNCDYFCMAAVKNSIAEYKSKNDSETWSLHPTNNAFLKSVRSLTKFSLFTVCPNRFSIADPSLGQECTQSEQGVPNLVFRCWLCARGCRSGGGIL